MQPIYTGNVIPTFKILVNGKPIKHFTDQQGQTWIEAKEGSKYSIEVYNPYFNRALAIVSVDGINVITGEPAEVDSEDGYVISAYSKIVIDGWRISDDKVKEFLFTFNKDKSYSAKLGNGKANLGVIGLAFYSEKQEFLYVNLGYNISPNMNTYNNVFYSSCTNDSSDNITLTSCCATTEYTSAGNPKGTRSVDFQAGTAKGKEVNSSVAEVSFKPGNLIGTYSIYYDSYSNLEKRGVIIKEPAMPQPFKPTKYCKDI